MESGDSHEPLGAEHLPSLSLIDRWLAAGLITESEARAMVRVRLRAERSTSLDKLDVTQ